MMKAFKFLIGGLLAQLLVVSHVDAAAGFNSISFKPSPSQGPYFSVEGSQTLGQWGHAAGLWFEFSNDSVIAFTPNNIRIRDVINEQFVINAGASLGLFDWLDIGASVAFIPYHNFIDPVTGTPDHGTQIGDVRLNFKARLLDNDTYPIGITLVPFIALPTGNENHFVGDGNVTGGGMLVFESKKLWDRFQMAINVGGEMRTSAALASGTTVDDRFLLGAALNTELTDSVDFIAELHGWTPFENFLDNDIRNLEINGGFRFHPWEDIHLVVGGGTGLLDAIGAPDYRIFTSIGYRHEAKEETLVIRTNKVHFAFDRATILPRSFPVLDDIAAQIRNHSRVAHTSVEGHTDSKGTDTYNQSLSERRARAVRAYLINKGVSANKLSAIGRGESQAVASNETREGRALNRRVEFHLKLSNHRNLRIVEKDSSPIYLER